MGLSLSLVGRKAIDTNPIIKHNDDEKIIALGGNPNVGKSTIFNELTGLNQHTGNWAGKTVTNAMGYCHYMQNSYILVDLPGCYSLMARSAEEESARDFICFSQPDAVIIVCDGTCLERNLNLVLQTIEITTNVIVCINLIDEADKKGISIDFDTLSKMLGVPVIKASARNKQGLDMLMDAVNQIVSSSCTLKPVITQYPDYIESAISTLETCLVKISGNKISTRWLALMLLLKDSSMNEAVRRYISDSSNDETAKECIFNNHDEPLDDCLLCDSIRVINEHFDSINITEKQIREDIATSSVKKAEEIYNKTVSCNNVNYQNKDMKIDKIMTGKWTAFPIMLLSLLCVFWLTITGANYPSQVISNFLFWIEDELLKFTIFIGIPELIREMLIHGIYRVLAWVVSVMLPPMAIFFPLFTLLEDSGFLPRIAFNLDKCFKKCSACGKQALTMCMGFGCNAAGVVGCRIIDSPRERLLAIITNCFVPCNGRFPALIAVITMFFIGSAVSFRASFLSAILLTVMILLGIVMTFIVSSILSKTILKGVPSSFTLELPPYRRPQFGKVIVRSIFDRTLFVLSRAAVVSAPAGMLIWIMANITINDQTLLRCLAEFLNPFAALLGLDGIILLAFILGAPANEIVFPIIIMAYMAGGSIVDISDLTFLKELLVSNGWTSITAISFMLFSLMHWPCSTTLLTIKKETKSLKWTFISFVVPTIVSIVLCLIFGSIARMI